MSGTGIELYPSLPEVLGTGVEAGPNLAQVSGTCIEAYVEEQSERFFWSREFSSTVGSDARKGSTCTLRPEVGPRLGSVGHDLGVLGRVNWQVSAVSLSTQPWTNRSMETPNCHGPIVSPLLLFLKYHSSPLRLGRHGTTASLQLFSLCDSHECCYCVCA